jgi:hypothetical protein
MLLLLGRAPVLAGQTQPWEPPGNAASAISITLVLMQHDSGRPTLIRRLHPEPRNVILLDSAALSPQMLSDAVFSLLVLEAMDPQGRQRGERVASQATLSAAHPVYPWADEALRRLFYAPAAPVQGVGRYRTLEIWIPRLRGQPR